MKITQALLEQRRRNVAAIAATRRAATHCKRGHEFTPENTYVYLGGLKRQCRICRIDTSFYWRRGLSIKDLA